jgi:hypothetical protein
MPKVRALCSSSITRPQRSNDPVRLPPWPPPKATLRPLSSPRNGSPLLTTDHLSDVPCLLPRRIERVRVSIASHAHRSLPQLAGGSTSALSLSRPAQASLALRPVGSLSRPKATFVARLQPSQLPSQAARQLPDSIDNYPGGIFLH